MEYIPPSQSEYESISAAHRLIAVAPIYKGTDEWTEWCKRARDEIEQLWLYYHAYHVNLKSTADLNDLTQPSRLAQNATKLESLIHPKPQPTKPTIPSISHASPQNRKPVRIAVVSTAKFVVGFAFFILCILPFWTRQTLNMLGVSFANITTTEESRYRDAVDHELAEVKRLLSAQYTIAAQLNANPQDLGALNQLTNTLISVQLTTGVIQTIPATPRYAAFDAKFKLGAQHLGDSARLYLDSIEQNNSEKREAATIYFQMYVERMKEAEIERARAGWQ